MCLSYDNNNEEGNVVEDISIRCRNFCRSNDLYLKDKTIHEMITQFVLNAVLNNMDLSWIISSNDPIKYDTEENIPYWLHKGPWYNTAICSKLHGTVFE